MASRIFRVTVFGSEHELRILEFSPPDADKLGWLRLSIDGREKTLSLRRPESKGLFLGDEEGAFLAHTAPAPQGVRVSAAGYTALCQPVAHAGAAERSPPLTPPMPSLVARVLVVPGERVEKNQALLVLSAMKLETTLRAPAPGQVKRVLVKPGDRVSPGDRLVDFEEE